MSFADEIRSQIQRDAPPATVSPVPERAEIERSTAVEFEKLTEAVKQTIALEAKKGTFDLKRRNNVIKGEGKYFRIDGFLQGCGIQGIIQKNKTGGGYISLKTFYPDIFKTAFQGAINRLRQDGIKASFTLDMRVECISASSYVPLYETFHFLLEDLAAKRKRKVWVHKDQLSRLCAGDIAHWETRDWKQYIRYDYKFRF